MLKAHPDHGRMRGIIQRSMHCKPLLFWVNQDITCHVSHLCQAKNVPRPPLFVIGDKPAGHMDRSLAITLPPANIIQGHYLYTADLLQLATNSSRPPYQTWLTYRSPIQLHLIALFLASHPDQAFAPYIHMGLLTGFRTEYSDDRALLCSHNANHPSARNNKTIVDKRLAAERQDDCLVQSHPSSGL